MDYYHAVRGIQVVVESISADYWYENHCHVDGMVRNICLNALDRIFVYAEGFDMSSTFAHNTDRTAVYGHVTDSTNTYEQIVDFGGQPSV
jgi:hypothetical protein